MNNFPRYDSYKDSGADWLGEIPAHWDLLKAKYLWKERIELSETNDETLLSVSQYLGVNNRENESRSESLVGYKKVKPNDLVINIMLAWLGGLGLSSLEGVVSPAYAVYELIVNNNPKFLHYLYRTELYLDEFARKSKGVVPSRWRMYSDDFGQVQTLLPQFSEQTAIAEFLDRKTAQIEQAIAQKERLIELLKERRQILIHNAVTRGLNPNVKLKYSGVDWIGEIPEHWEVKRLKFIFENIQTGTTPSTTNENFFDGTIDWFNPKDLNNEILVESERKLTKLAVDKREIKLFPKDSVLIVGIGATTGKTSYMFNEGTFNQQITGLHSDKNVNEYYFFLLKGLSSVMLSVASYTTLPILNNEFFKSFILVAPPIDEQREIVEYAKNISKKIETAISCKQKEIEKLKEYKAVLINSAVTGKIKVCGNSQNAEVKSNYAKSNE